MKIYIASSWKNEKQVKELAAYLREEGFEVDDFTDDSRGRFVFHYSELGPIEEHDAMSFLLHDKAQRAFEEDKKMIDWADAVVMLLPAGKSSHLEAGYAKGSGKKLIIYQEEFPKGEFDVMYGFANLITTDREAIVSYLDGHPIYNNTAVAYKAGQLDASHAFLAILLSEHGMDLREVDASNEQAMELARRYNLHDLLRDGNQ